MPYHIIREHNYSHEQVAGTRGLLREFPRIEPKEIRWALPSDLYDMGIAKREARTNPPTIYGAQLRRFNFPREAESYELSRNQ